MYIHVHIHVHVHVPSSMPRRVECEWGTLQSSWGRRSNDEVRLEDCDSGV